MRSPLQQHQHEQRMKIQRLEAAWSRATKRRGQAQSKYERMVQEETQAREAFFDEKRAQRGH